MMEVVGWRRSSLTWVLHCSLKAVCFINVMGRFIETFRTRIVCVLLTSVLVLHLVLVLVVCSSIALGLKGLFNFA